MSDFTEKVVLITGAGKGLGRKLTIAFSRKGANTAASDASPLHLEETARLARQGPGTCFTYDHNMSKKHFIQGTIEDIQGREGSLDYLINTQFLNPQGSLINLDDWDWQHTLNVNLSGAFYTLQTFLRVAENSPSRKHYLTLLPGSAHPALEIILYGLLGLTAAGAREGAKCEVSVNALSTHNLSEEEVLQKIFHFCRNKSPHTSGHLLTSQKSVDLDLFPF